MEGENFFVVNFENGWKRIWRNEKCYVCL